MRPATAADADFIVAAHAAPHARGRVLVPARAEVLAALERAERATFAVEADGEPVGIVLLAFDPDDPWLVELRRVVVTRPGVGIGTFAVDWAVRHAFEGLRARRVWLEVVASNEPARRLYERAGFALEGTFRAGFRDADGSFADLCAYGLLAGDERPPARRAHRYRARVVWTGNRGSGTSAYAAYERAHRILAGAKPPIEGSSDPHFRGDAARWNPEELLLASLAACHQLWYLHLCAQAGIAVIAYEDEAEAVMLEGTGGGGRFVSALLRPRVTIAAGGDAARALLLHDDAARRCFVAASVTFPVAHEPTVTTG